ncbi:MAG TPA: aspartyl/asparaginyl beta-hydroxylase domain-containing protein [Dongiaceae bacterium]
MSSQAERVWWRAVAVSVHEYLPTPKAVFKRLLLPAAILLPLAYFLPKLTIFYLLCGIYDVSRNSGLTGDLLRRYFLGNGVLTWLLSPFNILIDILSLPYINKGVYRLEGLPESHQQEVRRLIDLAREEKIVERMQSRSESFPRTMIFFKWYGVNVDTFLDVPTFHAPWKYIQTIGVSVFNRKNSTSRHFGYIRATLRMLYNLNDVSDPSARITVGRRTNVWKENKLFIFDDTLMHQSFNESDEVRYCLFVDIARPTPWPRVQKPLIALVRVVAHRFNRVFYKNWKIIAR